MLGIYKGVYSNKHTQLKIISPFNLLLADANITQNFPQI